MACVYLWSGKHQWDAYVFDVVIHRVQAMNFHTGYRCNVKDEKEMPSYDMMNVALRLSDKGSPSVGLAAD